MTELQLLRKTNAERSALWTGAKTEDTAYELLFRSNELGGEVGELQNAIKKLARYMTSMEGGVKDLENIKDEIGDVIICVDRVAEMFDIDLWEATRDKFNKTSDKHEFPIKL